MGVLKPAKWAKALLTFAFVLTSMSAFPVFAQEPVELFEQKIKAGLIYNFLKYTAWTGLSKTGGLHVCLYGGDAFNGYLSPLEGRTAQQAVIDISQVDGIDEMANCNLVYIHESQEGSLPDILPALQGKGILTASDIESFARKGGMVEMATENEQVIMYINENAVNRAGLKMSDRMLRLAKRVSE